jgi:hypothetical protein
MIKDGARVVEHKYVYEHPSVIEKREKEREKMRAAGIHSPDRADALMMAVYAMQDLVSGCGVCNRIVAKTSKIWRHR